MLLGGRCITPSLGRGGVNWEGGPEKLKEGVEVWGRGRSSEKREGGWRFSYSIFSKFIIFTFKNYFTLCKVVLCI